MVTFRSGRRIEVSLRLGFARLSGQHLHRFGEGLSVKLHHEIHRKATLALAVPEPFVSADGQAVVGFPAVFFSAAHQRFALRPEKFFQIQAGAELEIGSIVRAQLAAVRGTVGTFSSGDHMVHGVLNMAQSFVSLVAHLASPRFSSGAIRSL